MKAASIVGTIAAILALVVVLLKAVVGFVAFLSLAIKIIIVLAFVAVFAGVGFMIFRSYQSSRRQY